ncbi:MAG: PQQ-like beta-propeller repeat protein [Verrucomicrobiota bacterium]|nr:PQQ-like beta-propeller repeat protein [Verrucomicrobiota bacterium]
MLSRPFISESVRVACFLAVLSVHCAAPAFGDVMGRKWVQRYDGPDYRLFQQNEQTDSFDQAKAVAADSEGNALVAAQANGFHVSKYSASDGRLLWEQRTGTSAYFATDTATAVTADQRGDVIATGVVANDYYTAKYSGTTGALLWEQRYAGFGNDRDAAVSVAIDLAGDVVVTGTSVGADHARDVVCNSFGDICHFPATTDFYTIKYSGADGHVIWERRYDGPAASNDAPSALSLDRAGNVFVAGYATRKKSDGSLDADIYVAKYDAANGAILWQRFLDGDAIDRALDAVVNPEGDVMLVGRLGGACLVKLSGADGKTVWLQRNFSEVPVSLGSIAIDDYGNVAVAGACSSYYFDRESSYQPLGDQIYTAKFRASDGNVLWQQRYSRLGSDKVDLGAGAVHFDRAGNVKIAAMAAITVNPNTSRLNAPKLGRDDGHIIWEKLFSAIDSRYEETFGGMVLDPDDQPILAGGLYPRRGRQPWRYG